MRSSWAPISAQTSKSQIPSFSSPAIRAPAMQGDYDFISYPSIDDEVIADISRHDFTPSSLWKLVVSAGRIVAGHPIRSPDDYDPYLQHPNIESLLPHLFAYFSVLASCARVSGMTNVACTVMHGSYIYVVSLIDMANQFEWPYVLDYHIGYMNKRLCEMEQGDYTGWGPIDLDLYLSVLTHPRLAREVVEELTALSDKREKGASFGESEARQGSEGIHFAGRNNRSKLSSFLALYALLITFSVVYFVYIK